MSTDDTTPSYYTDHGAALGLAEGLRTLRRIDKTHDGFEWGGLPLYLEQERDRATADVKAAIRHLLAD